MPKISVDRLGEVGIIQDLAKYSLVPHAWSDGTNICFREDKVCRIPGDTSLWGGVSINPIFVQYQRTADLHHWLYASTAAIWLWDGSAHTDLTRISGGAYSATEALGWNGGVFGGITVLNNGIDTPQYWPTPNAVTPFENLANWPANTLARVIRPFGSFLVAGNITKGSTQYEHMFKWSHRAVPGTVPSSWDETDPTLDAGETDLSDTHAGPLLDMRQLGNALAVYKAGSIWEVLLRSDVFIFNFRQRFSSVGILTTNCATDVPRKNQHFVATGDDIVVHNLQQMESVIDRRWRQWLVNNMDSDNADKSFCVTNIVDHECWFCFPEVGATRPTLALIWNYVENTITLRNLPEVMHANTGIVLDNESDSWDADSGLWDADSSRWNDQLFNAQKRTLLLAGTQSQTLRHGALGNQIGDANIEAYVERKGLAIVGQDQNGQPVADPSSVKVFRRLYVKAYGAPFKIRMGAHDKEEGAVTWDDPVEFNPATDNYVDPTELPNGRFLAVRFESDTLAPWAIAGYVLEFDVTGEF